MKYTKTEVLIHKARRLVHTYNQQFLQQDLVFNQQETLNKLNKLIPSTPWINHHPINTIKFYILFKETWHKEKKHLYATKKKEDYTRIIEVIKKREINFEASRGSMLFSALSRQRLHID